MAGELSKGVTSEMERSERTCYTMWSVYRAVTPVGADRAGLASGAVRLFGDLAAGEVVLRGAYHLSGLRADADLMLWWYAPAPEPLQEAYGRFRRTTLGRHLAPVWSVMGLHRPAEFNASHVPAFLAGEVPRDYLCVYPFIRSYEWYLLPPGERKALLAEHGAMARSYRDVHANTVAGFGLGDYEWLLAFEANDLDRIVDLMRELRGAGARRHVRHETPFYTGRRRTLTEIVDALP